MNVLLQTAAEVFILEFYVVLIVIGIVGGLFGFIMLRRRLGPTGLVFWASKKKRTPILLHEGKDGILRFWNTLRGFTGSWRVGKNREMTILPESKSVYQVKFGPPMGLASSNGVATLPIKFLYYADRFVENFRRGENRMTPEQLAQYLYDLRYRESEIRSILATLSKIQNNELSIDDAVNSIMIERGYNIEDEATRKKLKVALLGAVETQGESYKQELSRILNEKKITVKESGWRIAWEQIKKGKAKRWVIKYIYTTIPVTLSSYAAFMPAATIDDLQAALLEAESAARLERTEDKGQQFRWLTLGIVIFMVMLGIYIVMQQLKVFG